MFQKCIFTLTTTIEKYVVSNTSFGVRDKEIFKTFLISLIFIKIQTPLVSNTKHIHIVIIMIYINTIKGKTKSFIRHGV